MYLLSTNKLNYSYLEYYNKLIINILLI